MLRCEAPPSGPREASRLGGDDARRGIAVSLTIDGVMGTAEQGLHTINKAEVQGLRETSYNATLSSVVEVGEDLRILRVVPDGNIPKFKVGQYISLGLGDWEPRVPSAQPENVSPGRSRMIHKRAYSISCSLMSEGGQVVKANDYPYLEFYVVLVRQGSGGPARLTPRLFALRPGARLFLGDKALGRYGLRDVPNSADVWFFSGGTGEAPHNAMIAELLSNGHQGRMINTVCVRRRVDAGYLAAHRRLENEFPSYRYVLVTTREPENVDATAPNYVGKRYLQDLVESGKLEREVGMRLDPHSSQVFVCGSSRMVGAPKGRQRASDAPPSGTMLDALRKRGFDTSGPREEGHVRWEQYG
jgi:ferredoxin--NADP+ reductase